jgi:uncharacterized protein (TIGR00369 family)
VSEAIRSWVEDSGYGASLGVKLDALSEGAARLLLPFAERNSNPGKALHGGCAASLALIGSQTVTRAALGPGAGPFHTAGLQVNYLAAAIGEDVVANATLLRRGKELCFVEIDVATQEGKSIAHVTSMVRGRFGAEAVDRVAVAGDDGAADPGPMGPHVAKLPFCVERGLDVQHMTNAYSRIVMPWSQNNADADGGVHEGALLALFDTTGAMAAWADAGPGPFKASTPSIQAQILAAPPRQDLIAYGKRVQRDGDLFWCDVEVAGSDGEQAGGVIARGTVIYRIVT